MRRRALCVGINYPGTHAELRGCVNDALDWQQVLAERGYDTMLLPDGAADKAGILGALTWLVRGARWGERLVLTFSGHGTYLPDIDGDETDGRDEALVTADLQTVSDDELYAVLDVPRGVRLTIVSDSCHSGTMARFAPGRSHVDARGRFLPPEQLGLTASPRTGSPARSRSHAMLLSGCQDREVSYDALIGGRYRGAMTAAALAALPIATSMRSWHAQTLAGIGFPQTPALTASVYQRRLRPLS